jgi:uncharacterized protein YbjQ (UPF0145 family)
MADFSITKVYTRNVITDSFQSIRNIFGLRLRGYEKMVAQGIKEVMTEVRLKYKRIKWHRLDIESLGKQSVIITCYGETQDE